MQPTLEPNPSRARPSRLAMGRGAAVLAIPLLVVLLYAPWGTREFVGWDDTNYIRDNPLLRNADGLRRIWFTFESEQYYPLTLSSYWIEYQIWGGRPGGYYAVNVGLHALNALLVFFVCRALLRGAERGPDQETLDSQTLNAGRGDFAAWLAAALFALHPVQVASVAWLAERKNTLSGAFALGAMLLYLNFLRRGGAGRYVLAVVLFALALLSKSAVLLLPVSLAVADALVFRTRLRKAMVRVAPLLVLSVVSGGVAYAHEHASSAASGGLPWWLRPFAASAALWFYVYKLLLPYPLPAIYPRWTVSGSSPLWFAPLIALAVAIRFVTLRWKKLGGEVAWGLAHYLLILLPVLGLAQFGYLAHAPVGDHFQYFATVGIFLALGVAIEGIGSRQLRAVAAGVCCGALAGCAFLTAQQANVWRNSQTLFTYTLQHNPGAAAAHQILGKNLAEAGRFAEAEQEYAAAVQARPEQPFLHGEHGAALRNAGRNAEALEELRVALQMDARQPMVLLNYGGVLADLGRFDEAEAVLRQVLALLTRSVGAHRELAVCLERQGKSAESEQEFRAALQLDSRDPTALASFAEALAQWSRISEAREFAQRGLVAAQARNDAGTAARLKADLDGWK